MNIHEGRRLEFSDIASDLHQEIQKNPYKFLGLPEGASVVDIRTTYIAKTKRYHPDMVSSQFDPNEFVKRYTPGDLAMLTDFAEEPNESPEKRYEDLKEALLNIEGATEEDLKRRQRALDAIQAAAHEKMVQLNIAFEAIKMRINPRQWNVLAGYDSRTIYDEEYGFDTQQIFLEGAGELIIVPKAVEYSIPGAYLSFDWGPPAYHEGMGFEEDYRHEIAVKHLFVYQELQEGREQITAVLLQPFFECFELRPEQQKVFMRLLIEGTYSAEYIWETLGIPEPWTVKEFSDDWHRSVKFETQVNQMQTLSSIDPLYRQTITMRYDNEQLILKDYSETILSQTDVMLLSTLAYGPMLPNG